MQEEKAQNSGEAEKASAAGHDVREIMDQVRQRVEEKKRQGVYRDTAEPFDPRYTAMHPAVSASVDIQSLRSAGRLDLEGAPITSHRPMAGWFIKRFKHLSRYWVRKYTDPLLLQQNYFNAQTANALEELKQEVSVLRNELEMLRAGSGKTAGRDGTEE